MNQLPFVLAKRSVATPTSFANWARANFPAQTPTHANRH